ncbi:zinc finger BED domain-containing protein RICESLEEPER 2-like [Capsicum galapagoense]
MPRNQTVDKNQTEIGFQSVQGGVAGDVAVVSWKFEQEQCRRSLCRMVIVDELPFRFVEKEGFRNFMKKQNHRGEDMANEISKCLRDWGIDKIFTITVDNSSLNDVTMKELAKIFTKRGTNFMNGEHLHVRCMTQIINLTIQDGLKVTGVSIEKVRKAVKYIRQSPTRCKRFQECCEDVDINSKKSLCLDVSTRWNSTYLMLNRAVECENGLMSYVYRDIGLSHYLQFVEDGEGTVIGVFLSDDWDHLISSDDDGDDLLGKIASNMKAKFDKYWGSPKKMNKMIFIACVLDPRHKFVSVDFALQMMFGKEETFRERDERLHEFDVYSLFENSSSLPSSSGSTVQSIGSLGSFMDDIMKHKSRNTTTVKTKLQKYLDEMAQYVLSIPISSVASECVFSTGGRILDSFRSSLTPKLVQTLVCLQYWIRSESQPVSIEEDIDVLEKLEHVLAFLMIDVELRFFFFAFESGHLGV